MDKRELYNCIDIEKPADFKYYENMASLLEYDEIIEENLLADLISELDIEPFREFEQAYFSSLLAMVPDENVELYTVIEKFKFSILGKTLEDMDRDELFALAGAIADFRKWYTVDMFAYDIIDNEQLSVMMALYGIKAATLIGEEVDYDFREALYHEPEGYDVRISDIVASS